LPHLSVCMFSLDCFNYYIWPIYYYYYYYFKYLHRIIFCKQQFITHYFSLHINKFFNQPSWYSVLLQSVENCDRNLYVMLIVWKQSRTGSAQRIVPIKHTTLQFQIVKKREHLRDQRTD
jgi:hypothetical protein